MKIDGDVSGQLQGFAEVVSLLEKNLRYVEALGMDEITLHDYRKIVSYLRSRSVDEIEKILGKNSHRKSVKKEKIIEAVLDDEEIRLLKGADIKKYLASPDATRKFLERIASVRFGVTKGALSNLRSRDALVEKISTLLGHEDTHEAISRSALGQIDVNQQD